MWVEMIKNTQPKRVKKKIRNTKGKAEKQSPSWSMHLDKTFKTLGGIFLSRLNNTSNGKGNRRTSKKL